RLSFLGVLANDKAFLIGSGTGLHACCSTALWRSAVEAPRHRIVYSALMFNSKAISARKVGSRFFSFRTVLLCCTRASGSFGSWRQSIAWRTSSSVAGAPGFAGSAGFVGSAGFAAASADALGLLFTSGCDTFGE